MEMNNEELYVFNPAYILKNDKNRVLISNRAGSKFNPVLDNSITNSFVNFIHPLHAILFAFFNGERKIGEIITEVSGLFEISEADAADKIKPFIENKKELTVLFNDIPISFPKNLIIKKQDSMEVYDYDFNEFNIPAKDLDLYTARLNYPLDAILMINNKCYTDCVYCYADRRKSTNCQIPLERIKEIIREAKSIGMRQIDVNGGEFFLYNKWEELISELISNDFQPYLSTKIPISEDTIIKYKDAGADYIQVSLDSVIDHELGKVLNVEKGYSVKIMETIKNLDKHGLKININTIITRHNSDIRNFKKLLEFLLSLKNINKISVGAAGYSIYKGLTPYLDYRADVDDLEKINEFLDQMKKTLDNKVTLTFGSYYNKKELFKDKELKKDTFPKRALCTGNLENFHILPDGKVCICEELYWHPEFIIGDLMKQSIMEVWNSKEALDLFNLSKERIKESSACKSCDEFFPCRKVPGVCWKEIIYAYGEKNWDFPDPRCPKAPEPINEYYIVN